MHQTVDEDHPDIILLREFVALGESGEAAVQDHVALHLRQLGCEVEDIAYDPALVTLKHEFASTAAMTPGLRRLVTGRLRGRGGRSIILFGHPDSEPVADVQRWREPPFAGAIRDGRMHGWGIADDLAGIAAMIAGLRMALASGADLAGDIIIASTPSKRHARAVTALLHRIPAPDAAVYLHPAESGAGLSEIKAFASGLLEFRIVTHGTRPQTAEPGHTAFAHRARSAVDGAAEVIAALRALGEDRALRIRHPRLEQAVGRSTNILVSSVRAGQEAVYNRIPETCVIEGSVSFPPGEAMGDVQAEIEAVLARLADATGAAPPMITWMSGVTGAETADGHPLYTAVAATVAAETGRVPFVNPMHTSSDIRNPILQAGIPTVGLGPLAGDLTQNGCADEWVDVADYLASVRVVAGILGAWCSEKPQS